MPAGPSLCGSNGGHELAHTGSMSIKVVLGMQCVVKQIDVQVPFNFYVHSARQNTHETQLFWIQAL